MIRRLFGLIFFLVFIVVAFVVIFAIGGLALFGTIFAAIWGFLVVIWNIVIGFFAALF